MTACSGTLYPPYAKRISRCCLTPSPQPKVSEQVLNKSAEQSALGRYAPLSFVVGHASGVLPTRSTLLEQKKALRMGREAAAQESRQERQDTPERRRLFRVVQDSLLEEERIEQELDTKFIPQHGSGQLISPRAFFVSPLFRVSSRSTARSDSVTLEMKSERQGLVLKYIGPELRQSDGLVFMALLNLTRDAQAGCTVHFSAEEMCRAVFQRYDGKSRVLLKDHIVRLQRGLVQFADVSVQLCQRFHFPSRGQWSVALDADIVTLFKTSMNVWVDFQRRRVVPEGLSSWLYGFIESQSRLIPMPLPTLQGLCGSDAEPESFARMLRRSLNDLVELQVIDEGWTIRQGFVRWRKTRPTGTITSTGSATTAAGEPAARMAADVIDV